MVSEELVLELQGIIKDKTGQDLTFEQASEVGNTLVNYFDLLAKIYHRMKKDEQGK